MNPKRLLPLFILGSCLIIWTGCQSGSTPGTTPVTPPPGDAGKSGSPGENQGSTADQQQPVDFESFVSSLDVEEPSGQQPVKAAIGVWPEHVDAGGSSEVVVRTRVAEGWHFYSLDAGQIGIPMKLTLKLPEGVEADGDWQMPAATPYSDPTGPSQVYEGEVVFRQKIKVADGVTPAELPISCEFAFQACNDKMCQPPVKSPLNCALTVGDGS